MSGLDNDYYLAYVKHPKRDELTAYIAECEDIIRALDMTFDEGEAFKAVWRNAALRMGAGKEGDSQLRNAEKVEHYGRGMGIHQRYARDIPGARVEYGNVIIEESENR